jgi:hypothetical protein
MLATKLALTHAGAVLAAAVISNLPDTLTPDPEISSNDTKAEDLMGYRLTQIFAIGLANALDPANANHWIWPDWVEKADAATGGTLLGKVADAAAKVPGLADVIGAAVPTPATPGTAK